MNRADMIKLIDEVQALGSARNWDMQDKLFDLIDKVEKRTATAYGEKVREAAAKMLEANLAHTFGRHCAPAIRSMPLPAQSEGEEK